FQGHVGSELIALELLDIVRIRHAKPMLWGDLEAGALTGFHSLNARLEPGRQVAVPKLKNRRLLTNGRVHNVTSFQLEGKVHGNPATMANKQFCHKAASTRLSRMLRRLRACGTYPGQSSRRRH